CAQISWLAPLSANGCWAARATTGRWWRAWRWAYSWCALSRVSRSSDSGPLWRLFCGAWALSRWRFTAGCSPWLLPIFPQCPRDWQATRSRRILLSAESNQSVRAKSCERKRAPELPGPVAFCGGGEKQWLRARGLWRLGTDSLPAENLDRAR